MVNGLVFQEKAAGNVKKVEKAKIGLIQFQVSPPKTDMDNQVRKIHSLKCQASKTIHLLNYPFVNKKVIAFFYQFELVGYCIRLRRNGSSS